MFTRACLAPVFLISTGAQHASEGGCLLQASAWRPSGRDSALLEEGGAVGARAAGAASSASAGGAQAAFEQHLHQVSARWGDKVVYGIFTSGIAAYHDKLLAQLETWAGPPADEGRFFAVGPKDMPQVWLKKELVMSSPCGDTMQTISCKEASIIAEGASRNASWMAIFGEDNYVDTKQVEAFLADKEPDEPVVYGCLGCGKGLYCHDNSEFEQHGGLCGGCGYFISRGALKKLSSLGVSMHELYDSSTWPNDVSTSCWIRRLGVPLVGLEKGLWGWGPASLRELRQLAQQGFLVTHYQTAQAMRWMHAMLGNASRRAKYSLCSRRPSITAA